MTVEAIRLQNFMAFEDTGWLDLRPITLLFGRNSSGKSALIRAMLLLRQSLNTPRPGEPFLFTDPYGVDIGRFQEMVHRGEVDRHVWFHFRCTSVDIKAKLDDLREQRLLEQAPWAVLELVLGYAARREAQDKIDPARIELADLRIHLREDDQGRQELLFQAGLLDAEDVGRFGGELWYVEGLLPERSEPGKWKGFDCQFDRGFLGLKFTAPTAGEFGEYRITRDLFDLLRFEIEGFLRNIIHLGPIRPEPQRRYSFNRATEYEWRARDWTAFLDFIGGKLGQEETDQINAWLQRLQLAAKADARPASEIGALVAEREIAITESAESSPLPLSAMGFGTAQVLPVIAQCVTAKPGSLVIVEQPELHLHPRGQAWLGDLYPAVIRKDIRAQRRACREADLPRPLWPPVDDLPPDGPRYLLETHSEHLLLRLRRCIAETYLKSLRNELVIPEQDVEIPTPELRPLLWPEDVAAYFVERLASAPASLVTPLEIDRFGDLPTSQGFADFFSDDAREILAITRAALAAEGLEEQAS